jgi:mRNA interferase RelE/StbE
VYAVRFGDSAREQIKRLDKPVARRIQSRLNWLAENFEAIEPQALTADWQDFFKLRVGDYRVIYTANRSTQVLTVQSVGHRSEVYKRPGH